MRSVRSCSDVIYDAELSAARGVCLSFNQRRRMVHFVFLWRVCTSTETGGCNFVLLWIFLMCLFLLVRYKFVFQQHLLCRRHVSRHAEFFSSDRRDWGGGSEKQKPAMISGVEMTERGSGG